MQTDIVLSSSHGDMIHGCVTNLCLFHQNQWKCLCVIHDMNVDKYVPLTTVLPHILLLDIAVVEVTE